MGFCDFYEKLIVSKMTRQTGLTRTNELELKWENQVFPIRDSTTLEATWRNWAVHESVKRYLNVFYLEYGYSHMNGLQFRLAGTLSRSSPSYIFLATAAVVASGIWCVSAMRRRTMGCKDTA